MPVLQMQFEPGDYDAARPTVEELMARYEQWSQTPQGPGDASNLQLLLEWKVGYSDGRLDRWERDEVEEFLLGWCPRKLSVPADFANELTESIANGFVFLGEQGLLSSRGEDARVLAGHARSLAGLCEQKMSDPANFGMAKSIFSSVGVDLDENLTPDRLNEVMEQFNALPLEQRKAITDPGVQQSVPDRPVIGPVVLPTDDEVRESAAAAPVLATFAALNTYFEAPGRPLTAKGNIKLADAQALSEIIGSEPLEEKINNFTHQRHTSARMPNLDHWQWWARQAGALRTSKSRMIGVDAWRKRQAKDPVREASKAFGILMDHGVVDSFTFHNPWSNAEVIDALTGSLLALMLGSQTPVAFDTLVDVVLQYRDEVGPRPAFGDPDYQARRTRGDVDQMLTMLERAGVVVQRDVTHIPAAFREERVGGVVELTPFGVRTSVKEAQKAGFDVETIDSTAQLSANDLARLANQEVLSPESWMNLLVAWLGERDDRHQGLRDVFASLDDGILLIVLETITPEPLVEDFADVLQEAIETGPPEARLPALAYGWLAAYDRLNPSTVSAEAVTASRLTMLGMLATIDPASVPETMEADRTTQDLLAEVAVISQLMPPNVVALLDAIGRHHPDKAVAKSARRETLRVRSRLASQRRG